MEIQEGLEKAGLDQDEIAVYMAALELGPSLVARIAKRSGVKRTTVYLVAKALMKKGILGQYETRQGIHLSAEPPEKLLAQMEEKTREIANILPELKALSKKEASRPQVKYFEGKEGYYTICEDSLEKHGSEILWLGDPGEIYRIIGEKYDNEHYIPTRLKRKIKFRSLIFQKGLPESYKYGYDAELLRHTEFLPGDFPFSSSQLIYQNKVAYFSSTKELICVLIESEDLAKMERAKFEMLWKKSGQTGGV
jgi:sugar-specific transcriptional regulator TrmB